MIDDTKIVYDKSSFLKLKLKLIELKLKESILEKINGIGAYSLTISL